MPEFSYPSLDIVLVGFWHWQWSCRIEIVLQLAVRRLFKMQVSSQQNQFHFSNKSEALILYFVYSAQFCTSIPMVGQLFVNNMRLTYTPINE